MDLTADIERGSSVWVLPVESASKVRGVARGAQDPGAVHLAVQLAAVVVENLVLVASFAL